MIVALKELENYLGERTQMHHRYMSHISKRVLHLYEDTFIVAAVVLDPMEHYELHLSENYNYVKSLEDAIEKIADSVDSALMALTQFQAFRSYSGKFGGTLAHRAVGQMSATNWWTLFRVKQRSYISLPFVLCHNACHPVGVSATGAPLLWFIQR
uniref:Uncharacterized protein n=1 Tax=Arundo donax TaxID=35708 RepID=A0A0A9G7H9_ARUDO